MNELEPIIFKINECELYLVSGACHSSIYDLRNKFANIHQLTYLDREKLEDMRKSSDGSLDLVNILQHVEPSISKNISQLFLDFKSENLSFYELVAKEILPPISSFWLETNLNCNFNCVYCYTEKRCGKISNKSLDILLDTLQKLDIKQISLIGGEPFLEKKSLFNIIKKIRAIFFGNLIIFSNGSLIDEGCAKILQEYKVQLHISIYGISDDVCESITRVKNVLNKQLLTIKLCNRYNIDYYLNFTINALNSFYNPDDFIDYFEIDPKRLRAAAICMSDKPSHIIDKATQDFKTITQNILSTSITSKSIRDKIHFHHCFGENIYISHDLTTYPCSMDHSVAYGNLTQNTFEDILENAEHIRRYGKHLQAKCKSCEYRYICRDCTADYGVKNSKKATPLCLYDHLKGLWRVS